jgi:two-component system nitrate/nitrite response regulator NarL
MLVADPTMFGSGVTLVLEREPDFEVLHARSLSEALEVAHRERPDVVLLDLDLPPTRAAAAIEPLTTACTASIVVWSLNPAVDDVIECIRAGASGYLQKEISSGGLLRSLRGIVRDEAPLPRHLATVMISALQSLGSRERAIVATSSLSSREHEVLSLIGSGASNREIANALTISEFTVKRHVQNILKKLALPSRHAAAALHRSASWDAAPAAARVLGRAE